jgi:hypothetical protein
MMRLCPRARVGFLNVGWPEGPGIDNRASFHNGLSETGFIEDRNVTIEYRFANQRGSTTADRIGGRSG